MKIENINIIRMLCWLVEKEGAYDDVLHFAIWKLVLKNMEQVRQGKVLREECLKEIEKLLLEFTVCKD